MSASILGILQYLPSVFPFIQKNFVWPKIALIQTKVSINVLPSVTGNLLFRGLRALFPHQPSNVSYLWFVSGCKKHSEEEREKHELFDAQQWPTTATEESAAGVDARIRLTLCILNISSCQSCSVSCLHLLGAEKNLI